ncbi:MAG TPA: DUF4340 domain-containing protein [Vitreimonas sp.]|uniref:DUF4340 domain-containing protein n=1 Tax=Vitreimonas sp. TaxID=3069702 RepID=UPI002D45890C|nr:DUF4340 domain-containing protein [Vitreimonas sp.]HYD88453.1 DUF4340 domain-containing protein [Vitreimonas sp.]
MTTQLAERRKGRALQLAMIALALVAVAAITLAIENRGLRPDAASGPVVPQLAQNIADAERIVITSADASYRIERVQRGEERVWVMRDRGDYPVTAQRLAQLTRALGALRYTRRMTNDPSKHERLGVTDPRQGGRGVLVQIEGGRGALLVNLILGVEPSGLYVRRPDDDQTWAAREGENAELPPLRDIAAWLEMTPLAIPAERLARVEIVPPEGRAYVLAREAPDQPWRIVQPALATLAQTSVTAAAEQLTRLSPVDVQLAPAVQGDAIARVRAITFEGVLIDAELIPSEGRTWVKLAARADSPELQAAAMEINSRSSDWAFALSEVDAQAAAPPLSALVPSVGPPQ